MHGSSSFGVIITVWATLALNNYLLFLWNSHWTGCPVIYAATPFGSSVKWTPCGLLFGALRSRAAGNIPIRVFWWTYGLISFGCLPRSGISGRRECVCSVQCIPSGGVPKGTILHSNQQCVKVPVALYPRQYLAFSALFFAVILVGLIWFDLIVVLICISLWIMKPRAPVGFLLHESPVLACCPLFCWDVCLFPIAL